MSVSITPEEERHGLETQALDWEQRAVLKRRYAEAVEKTGSFTEVRRARRTADHYEAEADRYLRMLHDFDRLRSEIEVRTCRAYPCGRGLTKKESFDWAGMCHAHFMAAQGLAPPPADPELFPIALGSPF